MRTGLGVGVVGEPRREGEKGDSAVVPFLGERGGCSRGQQGNTGHMVSGGLVRGRAARQPCALLCLHYQARTNAKTKIMTKDMTRVMTNLTVEPEKLGAARFFLGELAATGRPSFTSSSSCST